MRPIVWMSEPLAAALRGRLAEEVTKLGSAAEFLKSARDPETVSFLDGGTIEELDRATRKRNTLIADAVQAGPVVAICDGPLPAAVALLHEHPWLSHVVSAAMLKHPMAEAHFSNVIGTLTSNSGARLLDWVRPTLTGRRVRLTQASRRAERLERMGDFFDSQGVGARTIQQLRDAAEELLTNAFYDAPVAAGAVKRPISRTLDVTLPKGNACDLVYGCSEGLQIIRVRDPFGALSRKRIVEVLSRCSRMDMQVEVDETMGGAGLGLWRIFTAASFVAISVVNQHHTDFLVGIGKRANANARPYAFHLFAKEGSQRRAWRLLHEDSTEQSFATSITSLT